MKKYLRQLHADIDLAIRQAPPPRENSWLPGYQDEEGGEEYYAFKPVRLSDIFQIIPEAFPPQKMLTDQQVKNLLQAVTRLWKAWNISWEMPLYLPERKEYTAMVRLMGKDGIRWDVEKGGHVDICSFKDRSYCPFGTNHPDCYCRSLEEAIQHDVAVWEKHMRSQGIDPYEELSGADEAALEREIMIRELQRIYGDDWEKYADADLLHSHAMDNADDFFNDDLEDEFFLGPFFEDLESDMDDELFPPQDED